MSQDAELRLLSQADTVVAIQADEAAWVRMNLPSVVIAPHAAPIADAAQPGENDRLLFVGSNTAPNIVGLTRYYHEIWPHILARRPEARLTVAGSVARAMGPPPPGVDQLGVVADLGALYGAAGVVISPLYTGSGLKIKLIEALAAGKAAVGTSVTIQGVRDIVEGAILVEDDPVRFADAVVRLLGDADARRELGEAALACARTHFSPDQTFKDFVAAVRGGKRTPAALQLADPP
jgi:succinoglycan biosynthesis protein ExoO